MKRESMCDRCMTPGHCCRRLSLAGGSYATHLDDPVAVEQLIADGLINREEERHYFGPIMPFRVLMRTRDGEWVFWCPNLDPRTGRCLDYENRPVCCSSYAPGTDPLCVHHWSAE